MKNISKLKDKKSKFIQLNTHKIKLLFIMKYLTITLFTILIIVSCQNNDHEIYPKKYIFSDIVYGEIKTYTNSGEKNDAEKINLFLKNFRTDNGSGYVIGQNSSLNIYEKTSTNIPFRRYDRIELISESKATITTNDTTILFDLIRKDGMLYFQSLDIISGKRDIENEIMVTGNLYIKKQNITSNYMGTPYYNEKVKFHPIYIDTITHDGISGQFTYYQYKPCIYAVEKNDEIQILYTSFVESNLIPITVPIELSSDGYYYERYFGIVQNIQNEFNQDYLLSYKTDNILRKDTIVYKTNKIIFKEDK